MKFFLEGFLLLMATLVHAEGKYEATEEETRQRQQVEALRQYERSGHRETFGGQYEHPGNARQRSISSDPPDSDDNFQRQLKQYDWQKR